MDEVKGFEWQCYEVKCYTIANHCGGVLLRHLSLQMDYSGIREKSTRLKSTLA